MPSAVVSVLRRHRGGRLLALFAALAAAVSCALAGSAYAGPDLVVLPRPARDTGLSYFKLAVRPGRPVRAGAVELRNLGNAAVRVALSSVNGLTLSTLGSGYGAPGAAALGSTTWLRVPRGVVVLAPRRSALVPVFVRPPRGAEPGEYLSGVSIEALDQSSRELTRPGISIASVDRYVIGVELSVAGPRHPLIDFTGASLQREPAGLTFFLKAANEGNVILQDSIGRALISQGPRTVASVPVGPGTFVSGTTIAYPIPTPAEHPHAGAAYRVRAELRYAGGIAYLDTVLRYGQALVSPPQLRGGPVRAAHRGSLAWWMVALLALVAAGLLGLLALAIRRRPRRDGSPAGALQALDDAIAASCREGDPLALIAVTLADGERPDDGLEDAVRARMRAADSLCRLDTGCFLVVAPDTGPETANGLALDLRRQLDRVPEARAASIEVHPSDASASAAELLERIARAEGTDVLGARG